MAEPVDLQHVASVWNEAVNQGKPTLAALHHAFPGKSQRTIQRWLRLAREQALLPPAKPGSNRIRTPAAEAVAEALGVPYERLIIALREQAGGFLKIGPTEEKHARRTSEDPS
ncbi:hypothetical protein [Streptomyces acidiscabies]|uniref:hypothetical protein n=1 Tax=Streptomyces acidiscabies TaxID=42234 RepID=UPI00117C944F|nr:hypothetical protein [Streptomyces acidiscabies]